jgi:hypothetical protein
MERRSESAVKGMRGEEGSRRVGNGKEVSAVEDSRGYLACKGRYEQEGEDNYKKIN